MEIKSEKKSSQTLSQSFCESLAVENFLVEDIRVLEFRNAPQFAKDTRIGIIKT